MKARTFIYLTLVLILTITLNILAFGQITSSISSGRNVKTQEVELTETVVNQIMDKVGILFKEGMIALKDQKRSDAGEKFNKSVEVFLLSQINLDENKVIEDETIKKLQLRLRNCFNQLNETIYRMEFTSTRPPNLRSLSATCEWNWNNNDFRLADEIAKLVQIMPVQTEVKKNQKNEAQVGFNEQIFEPSPLDELAKPYKEQSIVDKPQNKIYTQKEITKILGEILGEKPNQVKNGTVSIVLKYIDDNFHDPYTVRYLEWSKITIKMYSGKPYWVVSVKLRAKNAFNAYRLTTMNFYIQKNKVLFSRDLSID